MLINWFILKAQLGDILYKVRLELKGNSLHVLLDIDHKNPSILLLTFLIEHYCVLHAGWVLQVGVLEVDELAEEEMRDEVVLYGLLVAVGVAEEIRPQHLEAGLFDLVDLVEGHRRFL